MNSLRPCCGALPNHWNSFKPRLGAKSFQEQFLKLHHLELVRRAVVRNSVLPLKREREREIETERQIKTKSTHTHTHFGLPFLPLPSFVPKAHPRQPHLTGAESHAFAYSGSRRGGFLHFKLL